MEGTCCTHWVSNCYGWRRYRTFHQLDWRWSLRSNFLGYEWLLLLQYNPFQKGEHNKDTQARRQEGPRWWAAFPHARYGLLPNRVRSEEHHRRSEILVIHPDGNHDDPRFLRQIHHSLREPQTRVWYWQKQHRGGILNIDRFARQHKQLHRQKWIHIALVQWWRDHECWSALDYDGLTHRRAEHIVSVAQWCYFGCVRREYSWIRRGRRGRVQKRSRLAEHAPNQTAQWNCLQVYIILS